MALIVCHSPKGGTGTTFLSAQIAMALASRGRNISLLTLTDLDSTPLHLGLPPAQGLPLFEATADEALVVQGINLRSCPDAADDADFLPKLEDAGALSPSAERLQIIDVPSGQRDLARRLIARAALHLCPILPTPDCLAILPRLMEDIVGTPGLLVVNNLDETRDLPRDIAAFVREAAGPLLLGRVRHDQSVPEAMAMLKALDHHAPSSIALSDVQELARALERRLDAAIAALSAPDTHEAAPGKGPSTRPHSETRAA